MVSISLKESAVIARMKILRSALHGSQRFNGSLELSDSSKQNRYIIPWGQALWVGKDLCRAALLPYCCSAWDLVSLNGAVPCDSFGKMGADDGRQRKSYTYESMQV